ncbi:beta-RFAP synthase [Azospirillum lipoferum]|uniref:GHMP kinase n=1 Tax=Azospirillum lipoferum TaxID=193 RepID=A0A5A9G481_AZOLI|nr:MULTISPECIES: beta-ribofuranosylaminobenzene 5'-phosphate synthase family protein [Azospirillum]KAA0589121.1 GHMP kinase [Azospirillum lipoferum]MCP1613434.1 beta-RFAP synthase [Azospirillum lipoferum]MDW5533130.1 GHMP kinase [Azospirillum sp. NL1]
MSHQRNRIGEVWVRAPARLHAGFVDLNGGLGRRFGSLGIAIDRPTIALRARAADSLTVSGPSADRIRRSIERLGREAGLPDAVAVTVEEAIPPHVGLGSGTQTDLAVAAALVCLEGRGTAARDLARALERGARSGIGLAAFEQGGVLLDGGRGELDAAPPLIARAPFPEDWRILLLLHRGGHGLHGVPEAEAFRRLPPFPSDAAAHLCRLMLMVALPALAEGDVDRFGQAIGELQRTVGDHFAPAQGGRFTSPLVADALAWLEAEGIAGVGQSSWGPTGFAIVGDATQAEWLAGEMRTRWAGSPLEVMVCRGRNTGATVRNLSAETEFVPAVRRVAGE